MKKIVLGKEVVVKGRDFFGRRTSVLLRPIKESGWYWQTPSNGIVPITPDLLLTKLRRVVLEYRGEKLEVFEHLGPLRFYGLDNLLVAPESNWLPYDGSAGLFWKACRPYMLEVGKLSPFSIDPLSFSSGDKRLDYYSANTPQRELLTVSVGIDYPRLGACTIRSTVQHESFRELMCVKTQGWPRYYRPLAIAAGWCGWPHRHAAVWPQEHPAEVTLSLFSKHRLLDLLGALSVLCPPGHILSGNVNSYKAGHKEDAAFVRSLAEACKAPRVAAMY